MIHTTRSLIRIIALGLFVSGLLGCVTPVASTPATHSPGAALITRTNVPIKIIVAPRLEDGVLCPIQVDPIGANVFAGRDVTWKVEDTMGVHRDDYRFQIFFDPIRGTPLKSANGSLSRTIDSDAPRVLYKYTIWDWPTGNNPPECDPFDPWFLVY